MDGRAPLHLETVAGEGAPGAGDHPERTIVFLHGILGSGDNWLGFARRLVAARPGWRAILIDLRLHGRSGAGDRPHTVEAAALDVVAALAAAGIAPRAMSGHSFGSKVAYRAAELLPVPPRTVWLLDADPGARPPEAGKSLVLRVIDALRGLPRTYARREEFTGALAELGFSASLAGWLGKNLVREGESLRLPLDLDAIEEVLADFHALDLWPRLAAAPFALHAVIGGRSDVLAPSSRDRLAGAAAAGSLRLHELPDAGHWLHIDAPKALLERIAAEL